MNTKERSELQQRVAWTWYRNLEIVDMVKAIGNMAEVGRRLKPPLTRELVRRIYNRGKA